MINLHFSKVDESHLLTIIYNLICAVNFLHSAKVVHRDIKPSNILINNSCEVKLCDFGMSRVMPKASKEEENLNKFKSKYNKSIMNEKERLEYKKTISDQLNQIKEQRS